MYCKVCGEPITRAEWDEWPDEWTYYPCGCKRKVERDKCKHPWGEDYRCGVCGLHEDEWEGN